MYRLRFVVLLMELLLSVVAIAQRRPPEPYGPCPTEAQVRWQRMEMNMFCHFGPNTFSGREWGGGNESADLFNPSQLDCDQWVAVARKGGFRGIIITAKHHDGFCLWPNPASSHTVRESGWRNGEGDVLLELSQACSRGGVKFGVYISPWDRHDPTYGTPWYNETFRRTLEHALTRYGEVFEQWFDGANGEGPRGKKQEYDWGLFNHTVARLQPQAVIFSDVGPGCHWVGNEQGVCGETCWSRLNTDGFQPGALAPSLEVLNQGERDGKYYMPAEVDVSIRPGWFHHSSEHPKTVQELLGIYYTSVGRNSVLLLNVPPDRRGLIDAEDSARVMELRAALDAIFGNDLAKQAHVYASNVRGEGLWTYRAANVIDTNYHRYWAVDNGCLHPTLTLAFDKQVSFNRVMLQEYIPLGQRVENYEVQVLQKGKWVTIATPTTIGYKRILLTDTYTTKGVRIRFTGCRACPVISRVGLFMDTIYQGEGTR
jgi:alpha-L-fucosidase